MPTGTTSPGQKAKLAEEAARIDLGELDCLVKSMVTSPDDALLAFGELSPDTFPCPGMEDLRKIGGRLGSGVKKRCEPARLPPSPWREDRAPGWDLKAPRDHSR
ncbi:MAG: hypothetical protein R3F31_16680 [Verrucomicrobiales bacterium]